jgi:hypothetical protein
MARLLRFGRFFNVGGASGVPGAALPDGSFQSVFICAKLRTIREWRRRFALKAIPMTLPKTAAGLGRFGLVFLTAATLAACASTPESTPPAAAAAQAEPEVQEKPMEVHEASAECWMRVDKMRVAGIDQRAKLVDKCISEKMKGAKPAAR